MRVLQKVHTQLTAPGNGTKIVIGEVQPVSGRMSVKVTTIDTDVTWRAEYSNDDFATVSAYSVPVTETANIDSRVISLAPGYRAVRPVFVSENGGTGVKLDVTTEFYTN